MTDLNAKYREEGWGKITDAALGIEPKDVESQAREVARWADAEIARLTREKDAARGMLIVERTIGDHFGDSADEWRGRAMVIAARLTTVVDAANGMLEMYVEMVNSGDCGNWDPETESEVIALRAAIAAATETKP